MLVHCEGHIHQLPLPVIHHGRLRWYAAAKLSERDSSDHAKTSTDRVFVHALNTVKRLPRTGSARPPDADRLKLYGLYKQSTEGDVEGTMGKPDGKEVAGGDGISELEKWFVRCRSGGD